MKKYILALSMIAFSSFAYSQVGINTQTPASTLTVNGSFEAAYKEISSSYTLNSLDSYISYAGTSDANIILPTVGSGTLAFTGRLYKIKNVSNFNLALLPNGSDMLRNFATIPKEILLSSRKSL